MYIYDHRTTAAHVAQEGLASGDVLAVDNRGPIGISRRPRRILWVKACAHACASPYANPYAHPRADKATDSDAHPGSSSSADANPGAVFDPRV